MGDNQQISSDLQAAVTTAIEQFRQRMAASNTRYLHDCVNYILTLDLPPSEAIGKLGHAVHFVQESVGYRELTTIDAVFAPGYFNDDWFHGTEPPKNPEEQQEYIKYLTEKINSWNGLDTEVQLPADYIAMLRVCDKIADPDLREVGVSCVRGTGCRSDEDWVSRNMDVTEEQALLDKSLWGWEVKTGWLLDNSEMAECSYIFCRWNHEQEPKKQEDLQWKWRIFYENLSSHEILFDSLIEYIEWLGSWYEREVEGQQEGIVAEQINNPKYVQGLD